MDIIDDCLECSNSGNEFGFNLDPWEYAELFGNLPVLKSIINRIPDDKILPLIIISMNMRLLDGLRPVIRREKKVVRDRAQAWEFIQSWSADLFYQSWSAVLL